MIEICDIELAKRETGKGWDNRWAKVLTNKSRSLFIMVGLYDIYKSDQNTFHTEREAFEDFERYCKKHDIPA